VKKKSRRRGQSTDDNITRRMRIVCCKLKTKTHRVRNTYCSSTTTIVTRTSLSVKSYVHCLSFSRMTKVVVKRQVTPWLYKDYIYKLTPLGREQARLLQILHGFSEQVSGVAMCVLGYLV